MPYKRSERAGLSTTPAHAALGEVRRGTEQVMDAAAKQRSSGLLEMIHVYVHERMKFRLAKTQT